MSHTEWLADRANFQKLLGERDPQGDLPIAIRLDLTPEEVGVMAPGVTDFDEKRMVCATWVRNFLAKDVERMGRVLAYKAGLE